MRHRFYLFLLLLGVGMVTVGVVLAQPTRLRPPDEEAAPVREEAVLLPAAGTTTRVSLRDDDGQANGDSFNPQVSADGRYVVFASNADNLVSGDDNGVTDIFVRDRETGETLRASVNSDGDEANFASFAPVISDDAHFVAFCSYATNLIVGDDNNVIDVFYHSLISGNTYLASRSVTGGPGDDVSCDPADNILEARGPDISADGRYIVFESYAGDLVGNDGNNIRDIFRYDTSEVTMERVSLSIGGAPANADSRHPTVSADGQRVAFASDATNLVDGDTNGYRDVFVRNLNTSRTRLISQHSNGTRGNGDSFEPEISDDGLFVVFSSFASNLVDNDSNNYLDVFIRDRAADETGRVSIGDDGEQTNVFAEVMAPSVSGDGRYVVFQTYANSLVPGEPDKDTRDVFLRDREAGTTTLVSVSSGGALGNASSREPVIGADGTVILFSSKADNLVGGDTNGDRDVFLHRPEEEEPPPPPAPTLVANYQFGQPGSQFTFSGENYVADQNVGIYVNGRYLNVARTDWQGMLTFRLDTDPSTDEGAYRVEARGENGGGTAVFYLDAAAPLRSSGGDSPIFDVPDGIAYGNLVYLPIVAR